MSVIAPVPIVTQGPIEVGDTVEFLNKFNAFQSELVRFSAEANEMATELNILVSDFSTLVSQSTQEIASQTAASVAQVEDKTNQFNQLSEALQSDLNILSSSRESEINAQATAHKSEMSAFLAQCEQALSSTQTNQAAVNSILEQSQQVAVQIAQMLDQVVAAQQQALILATEQLPDVTVGRLEKEIRKSKMMRLGIN